MINDKIKAEILEHAKAEFPRECCGLVVVKRRKHIYVPCKNTSESVNQFRISEEDFAKAEDQGKIAVVVHSHPKDSPNPSEADKVECERSGVPWYIVNPVTGEDRYFEPSGYVSDLLGRTWVHGIQDCYTLIHDWYKRERNIKLPDAEREHEWWLKGFNLYRDNIQKAGFVQVELKDMQIGDVILMQLASPVDNHGAIYIGNNMIVQHVMNHLSSRDIYGGYWRKITTSVWRYAK